MLPFLYAENRDNPQFTMRKFFLTLLRGTIHSLINFFFVIYMLDESVNSNGKMGGLWFISVNLFTNILIIVSAELLIFTKYHTWINFVIIIVITFIAYIIFIIVVHNLSLFNSVGTMGVAFSSPRMWLNMLLVGGTCGLIDLFLLGIEFVFFPNLSTKMQELVNKGINLNIDNFDNMPNLIKEILGNYNDNNFEEEETEKEEGKKESENDDINIRSRNDKETIQKEENTDKRVLKMKNNKASKDLINQKGEDSSNTNDNLDKNNNNNNESKVKNNNKSDVMVIKSQNQKENIEEDNNSKEAFLK